MICVAYGAIDAYAYFWVSICYYEEKKAGTQKLILCYIS